MPLYDFQCQVCEWVQEEYASMEEELPTVTCCCCGNVAVKIISFNGGLKTDHPAWLDHNVRAALQGDGEKPIETRKEHDAYLKDNGIVQVG